MAQRFPSLETLAAGTVFGAAFMALVGDEAQQAGLAWLIVWNLGLLLATLRYGFGTWELSRRDPLGNVVGLVSTFTAASVLVAWIAWTNDSEHLLFLDRHWGVITGGLAGLVVVPGLVHEMLRHRIGANSGLSLLVNVLYSADNELREKACVGVAAIGLPAAETAVPPLLLLVEEGPANQQLMAHAALAALGVPVAESAGMLEHELTSGMFRAATTRLLKFRASLTEFLVTRLARDHKFLQRRVCELLAQFGTAAEPARTALLELSRHQDRALALAAQQSLAALAGPSLGALLFRQWPRALFITLVTLALFGCSYTPLGRLNGYCLVRDFGGNRGNPALVQALGDHWTEVSWMARKALLKRGAAAVPAIREGLNDANPAVRKSCAELLANLNAPPAAGAKP